MHVRPKVREGQPVKGGDSIASVGPWYNDTHLHFGIIPSTTWPTTSWGRMKNMNYPNQNGYVDPVDWLENKTPKNEEPPKVAEKFTVEVSVWPGLPLGNDATVTFYGKDGFYKNGRVDRTNKITFTDVPGGSGVKVRIDVDLKNKRHKEFYDQEINGANHRVSFTYRPL